MNLHLPCSFTKYTYTSSNSLQMAGILYCIPFKKVVTLIGFTAEKSHYYKKTHKDFLIIIPTIEIKHKHYLELPGIKINSQAAKN